jgi:hypothetical protein
MAVAMPDGGLITPVLKNADSTDIYQMSRDWADLVKRARSKQVHFQSCPYIVLCAAIFLPQLLCSIFMFL